jgi:DNA repair photolyase
LPGFIEYKPKFIAITIEGTPEVLGLLSPGAPSFDARVAAANRLSSLGIDIVIRLDPIFIHLFQALYGGSWFEKIERLLDAFAAAGARHVIGSTGRLSKRSPLAGHEGTSIWQRIHRSSTASRRRAKKFEQEYSYEGALVGGGYRLPGEAQLSQSKGIG